jgi:light-regulated signal transduction histidine kinase (bacteriophytochrome)
MPSQETSDTVSALRATINELETFSYSVSHDLRAPLRAIDGFAKILAEDHAHSLNEEGKRLLEGILKNTAQMSRLIEDLLAFSRIARKDFVKGHVPMEDLAKNIIEELRKTEAGARCRFQVNPLPDIEGDLPLLRQVWTNLLSNAIKFSRNAATPTIEISANQTKEGIIYLIHDNGAGFEMEYIHKLFGVFQRLHSTLEFEGNGLGLAIVQRVILKHGGRVWAEGEPNKGATFYFLLPHK